VSVRSRFLALTPAARLLVVNQFGINVGFYMVVPFLATHLVDDLGYAAALVGVVLGVRTLSQQGLFLVGGTAADRLGARPVIVLGCALRVLAFGLFAVVTSPVGFVAAAVLTGFAGALFNPAVRAYLSREAGEERAAAFAVFNTAADAGAFAGPLLGAALLAVDFRLVAAVACATFLLLTVAQALVLPAHAVRTHADGVLGSWGVVVRNRRFVAFTLCGSAYFALYNQVYLVFPLEAKRVTGTPVAVGVLFAVSTVTGVALYVRIAAWGGRRWPPGTCVAVGLALMGAGFAPVAVSAPLLPTATGLAPAAARGRRGVHARDRAGQPVHDAAAAGAGERAARRHLLRLLLPGVRAGGRPGLGRRRRDARPDRPRLAGRGPARAARRGARRRSRDGTDAAARAPILTHLPPDGEG
jgi:MFS family permease